MQQHWDPIGSNKKGQAVFTFMQVGADMVLALQPAKILCFFILFVYPCSEGVEKGPFQLTKRCKLYYKYGIFCYMQILCLSQHRSVYIREATRSPFIPMGISVISVISNVFAKLLLIFFGLEFASSTLKNVNYCCRF